MAAHKKVVLQALGEPHLRAIGMVAAQWSNLEVRLLWVVSKVFGITLSQAIILTGAQNATAWCDMLRKETNPPIIPGKPKKKTPLDIIANEIAGLLTLRNNIVHSSWDQPGPGIVASAQGMINSAPTPLRSRLKSGQTARGMGIPKRGNKLLLETEFTAAQMTAVATRIEAAEQALRAWLAQRKSTNRLAEMLQNP